MVRTIAIAVLALATAAARAELTIETVAEGLEYPWCLAFLPGDDMLVTERSGRLRRISDGKLEVDPIGNVPDTYVAGQGGFFDVVADPDFASNQTIYLSFAHGTKQENATRVVRATLDGDALAEVTPIFTARPSKNTPHHYGGRMAFLSDGSLLVTVGDGFNFRERAQELDNHFGKVVRITADGSVPADNPFVGRSDALPEIWSFGHRNAQAILVLPSGVVLSHEHGPRGGDELNRIEAGKNYGWPAISYGIDYSGQTISPYTELPGMEQPLVHWVPSIAPAGMAFYDHELFAGWRGSLLIAALAERSVRRLELRDGRVVAQHLLLGDLGERFRDVRVGPDGAIYLLTDSSQGKVLRVTPGE